jgi:TolB protein
VLAAIPAQRSASGPSVFPGANGRIAFQSARKGTFDLFDARADGAGVRALTSGPDCDALPAWSPDGRSLVFERTPGGRDERRTDLYLVTPGGRPRRLTFTPGFDGDPAWSPDGRFIVFESKRDGNSEIYLMLANGTRHTRLTTNPTVDADPVWSPGGRKIAFTRRVAGGPGDIFLMDADGSSVENITNTRGDAEGNPAWTPGGGLVLFERNRGGNFDIWATDRLRERRLTDDRGLDSQPTVSPDGSGVAFVSERIGRNRDVWVMNLDGSGQRRLVTARGYDAAPDWQPVRSRRASASKAAEAASSPRAAGPSGTSPAGGGTSGARPLACVTG